MQRQSYQVKTVLELKGARKKTFLAFKESLGNPLSRSPCLCRIDGQECHMLPNNNLQPSPYLLTALYVLCSQCTATM